ncbi:hypothetical protein NS183_07700 [Microbacterium testaceum]|nr:hypothetical protein NS183_07700 [Microbacterium testaceum]
MGTETRQKVIELIVPALAEYPDVAAAAAVAAEDAVDVALAAERIVRARTVDSTPDDDAVFGQTVKGSGRLLIGWARNGNLSKWTRKFFRQQVAGIIEVPKIPGVFFVERTKSGRATRIIYDDGRQEFPGLIGGEEAGGGGVSYTETVGSDTYLMNVTTGLRTKVVPVDRTKLAVLGSSTMNKMLDNGAWAAWATPLGATPIDLATGGMCAEQILAQFSRPLVTNASVTIPTSGSVSVTSTNVPSTVFGPFSWTGTLGGVAGTMSKPNGTTSGPWTFTPTSNPGSPVVVPAGSVFVPTLASAKDGVVILNLGKNNFTAVGGGTTDPALVFEMTKGAYEFASATGKYALVVGHFIDTNTPESDASRTRIEAYNSLCRDYFGARYIGMKEYLTSAQVWTDTGLTPDSADLAQQALGNKPPQLSLYTSGSYPSGTVDPLHMNPVAETAVIQNLIGPYLTVTLNWMET